MAAVAKKSLNNANIRSRVPPPSGLLVDLHVYLVPREKWVIARRLPRNQIIDDTISLGFVRVIPHQTIHNLRRELSIQLGNDVLPRDYIFIRCVGRNYAQVKPRQERDLKVKNFAPPYASDPEIFLLELMPYDDLNGVGVVPGLPNNSSVGLSEKNYGGGGMDKGYNGGLPPLADITDSPPEILDLQPRCKHGRARKSSSSSSALKPAKPRSYIRTSDSSEPSPQPTTPFPNLTPSLERQFMPGRGLDSEPDSGLGPSPPDPMLEWALMGGRGPLPDIPSRASYKREAYDPATIRLSRREPTRGTLGVGGKPVINPPRQRHNKTSLVRVRMAREKRLSESPHRHVAYPHGLDWVWYRQQQTKARRSIRDNSKHVVLKVPTVKERHLRSRGSNRVPVSVPCHHRLNVYDEDGVESDRSKISEYTSNDEVDECSDCESDDEENDKTDNEITKTEDKRKKDKTDESETKTADASTIVKVTGEDVETVIDTVTKNENPPDEPAQEPPTTETKITITLATSGSEKEIATEKTDQGSSKAEASENKTDDNETKDNSVLLMEPRLPSPSSERLETRDSEIQTVIYTEQERLLAELSEVVQGRQAAEIKRAELVERANELYAKVRARREVLTQQQERWRHKYLEEVANSRPHEEACTTLRAELNTLHRRLLAHLEGRDLPLRVRGAPSKKANQKITAARLQHEIKDLQQKVKTAKLRLDSENKLKEQANKEVKELRTELSQKKSIYSYARSHQLASLGLPRDPMALSIF